MMSTMLLFLQSLFSSRRFLYEIIAVVAVIGVSTGLLIVNQQSINSNSEQYKQNSPPLNTGIIYLPVTREIAQYYALGVDSGALVTGVVKGGPFDKAGIKAGDVITSFNNTKIGESSPLLGLMRSCPVGASAKLEVWTDSGYKTVTIQQKDSK